VESLPGTLEPEGFSSTPTTGGGLWVARGGFTRYPRTGGFLDHTHNVGLWVAHGGFTRYPGTGGFLDHTHNVGGAIGSPWRVYPVPGTGGFLDHTHNVGGAIGSPWRVYPVPWNRRVSRTHPQRSKGYKAERTLRGAVTSPYGVYGWPLEPEGLTSAPTTVGNHLSYWLC